MIQRIRLLAGLVLFTYVTTHLLNHSLGLISLAAAEAGRFWFLAVWRQPVVTLLLYASLLTHVTLALYAIYRRRHLRIPVWEIVRLSLGLLIPLQLVNHVFGTRVAHEAFGYRDTYAAQVLLYWVLNPMAGAQQIALLLVAWCHGWLGMYHWLRVKPYRALTLPTLQVLGPLLPLVAVLGFVAMGHQVDALAADPAWRAQAYTRLPPDEQATIVAWREAVLAIFLASAALVFVARPIRTAWQRRRGVVRVAYPDGRSVAVPCGTTILEASRIARIPHASLCGGRGRCSTCRTRIGAGLAALPPPAADEARVLRRIQAAPNVRLACQTRPTADLQVFPLLPLTPGLPSERLRPDVAAGTEQEIAVLFADMRAFTSLAEQRLPYDVVFVLNQYTTAMGQAIERAGGFPNQFVGDGIMALFGLDTGREQGCRQALGGAVEMARALVTLNGRLAHELGAPLRIGIGIHAGRVIVGEMGYGPARYLTAIGDVVNTASRIEALTKDYDCQLIVSEDVAAWAGVDLAAYPRHNIQVRGRGTPLAIYVVPSALDLEPALAPAPNRATAGGVDSSAGRA
jgi:adenylate cyclase